MPAFGHRGLTGRLRSTSKADQEHSGLQAGLSGVKQVQDQKRARSAVGAGLPAMQATRSFRNTEVMSSQASFHKKADPLSLWPLLDLAFASTTQVGFQAAVLLICL